MTSFRRVISRPAVPLCLGVIVVSGVAGLELTPQSRPPALRAVASSQPVFALPAPDRGFAIPSPRALSDATGDTRWAPVIMATVARLKPSTTSPAVNHVSTRTPEGTVNLVVASAEVMREGTTWVRVSLPSLDPRGAHGWLPRAALGGWSFVDTRVVVDRKRLTLTLFRGDRAVFSAPVGIGTPSNPTPGGSFYIRDRLSSFASPTYGPLAFGTSARAPYLTDWPGGGYVGIHGTDEPRLIPGRISHGCIRMTNSAILRLGKLLPVGTPVIIR